MRMLFVDGVSVPVSQELAPHEGVLSGEKILKLRSKCDPHRSPEVLVPFLFQFFFPYLGRIETASFLPKRLNEKI